MGKSDKSKNNKKSEKAKDTNKIIHYFWFGGKPLPELTQKCIESWKKYLPDFEIKAWNENNFDVEQCTFVKEAYEQKKWAFVADYARFKALEEYGGLYLDTDMEITADISKYLEHDLFLGCEDSKMINAAVVWAKEKNNKHVSNIVKFYESMDKFNPTGDLYEMSVPRVLTSYFEKYGFDKEKEEVQVLDDNSAYIYPMEYFYPLSYDYQHNKFTDNSCMIHHFDATWISKMEKFKTDMKRKNMIWVVYVIDFFINTKNKIKFFCNYRDIVMFITMFVTLLLAVFSFTPIEVAESIPEMFRYLKENISMAMLQIAGISAIWTFLCAKIRNISLNYLCDKLTGTDSDSGEYRTQKLSQENMEKVRKRERHIFLVQILICIALAIFPIFNVISAIPSISIVYSLLIAILTYFIYLGVRKKFRYRMLELVPIGIVIASLIMFFPSNGILVGGLLSISIFAMLFKYDVAKKRKIAFALSLIVSVVIFGASKLLIKNNLPENNTNYGLTINIGNFDRINTYDSYLDYNENTEFNAGKSLFGNNLRKNISNNNFSFRPTIFAYLSLLIIAIIAFVCKKADYIIMMIPILFNMISLKSIMISSVSYSFTIYFMFAIVLMILIVHVLEVIFNKN